MTVSTLAADWNALADALDGEWRFILERQDALLQTLRSEANDALPGTEIGSMVLSEVLS